MNVEQKLILEMFKEGKINVEETEKLLEEAQVAEKTLDDMPLSKSVNRKFLRVLVMEENKTKVNINIPLALAEVGLKFIPKDQLKIEGKEIDLDEILRLIKAGNQGELVNIETTDKDKEVKVKIFIE